MIRRMRGPWRLDLGGSQALVVEADERDTPSAVVRALGLPTGRPTVVVVGGAAGMSEDDVALAGSLLERALVPVVEELEAVVVDGGTDAGIMRALGDARVEAKARFPLVGVVVHRLLRIDDDAVLDAAPPEPGHSHFVLVPGRNWGDETEWLAAIAGATAANARSMTLLVNGGEVAWADATASVEADRPVLALAGSGRTADAVAAAVRGEDSDPRARALVHTGLVRTAPFDRPDAVAAAVRDALEPATPSA
jgi:hypothetical protein